MALGTTNVSIGDIYSEVGKSATTNLSLGDLKYAANDINHQTWGTQNSSNNTNIGSWRSYDHLNMKFRYSAPFEFETYRDTSSVLGAGISLTDNGTSVGDYTGTLYFDGVNDYAYFEGVASGKAYKQNPSGYMTLACWMLVNTLPSANVNIMTTDLDAYADNDPYKGFYFNLTTTGQIRPVRGDGTGAASSDRRSFGTSWNVTTGEWQLCVYVLSNSVNTASSSTNWSYVKRGSGDASGMSFISGTGGSLAFQTGAGGSTDAFYLSTGVNSRHFDGQYGHIWVFAQALSSANVDSLWDATSTYYGY